MSGRAAEALPHLDAVVARVPAPAAEARFWRGRALLLGGDAVTGRRLAETALQTLRASPQAADRQLAGRLAAER